METMLSRSTDAPVPLGEFVPEADDRIVMHGLDWAGYQSLLALRGSERSCPRIAYLDGVAELMTPSWNHEHITSNLGRLLEVYFSELGIAWTAYRSWTPQKRIKKAGLEPDECYLLGDHPDPARQKVPDLAIEVVWTSGGIDKLEIYRRLSVREVWFWQRGAITVFVLGSDGYRKRRSTLVPGVDLKLLFRMATVTPHSTAIARLRAALQRQK